MGTATDVRSASSVRAAVVAQMVEAASWVFLTLSVVLGVVVAFTTEYEGDVRVHPYVFLGIAIAVGGAFQALVVVMFAAYITSRTERGYSVAPRALATVVDQGRPCPYCAESINLAAVVCRHCGRDVPKGEAPQAEQVVSLVPGDIRNRRRYDEIAQAHPGVFDEVWRYALEEDDWTANPSDALRQACGWAEHNQQPAKAVRKAFGQGLTLYGSETALRQDT